MLNIRELEAWIFGAGRRNLEGMGGYFRVSLCLSQGKVLYRL